MSVITEEEYRLLKAQSLKATGKAKPSEDYKPEETSEAKLMGRIMQECKARGFPCQCFRASRKAIGFITPGWPD